MATNFPTSLDAFTNPTAVDTLDSPPHDVQHADANDAIEALQAKVGVDGSAVTGSLDYKVAAIQQTLSGRNFVYNGAMQVAQRGTSVAGITFSNYHTADRWKFVPASMGTWTESVENDAPTGSGFAKSLKFLCTTADAAPGSTDTVSVIQNFEGQDVQRTKKGTSAAEQLTVSFWVKSNVTGTFNVELNDNDNGRFMSQQYSVLSSGTWEFKTVTFVGDTTGVLDNDNGLSLFVRFWLGSGSAYTTGSEPSGWLATSSNLTQLAPSQTNVAAATNNYWQITGVQLETGPVATPFEHLPYGVELARCQRYYYAPANKATTAGIYEGTNYWFIGYFGLPVSMRTTPTISGITDVKWINSAGGSSAVTTVLLSGSTKNDAFYTIARVSSITTLGYAVNVIIYDGSVSAEL